MKKTREFNVSEIARRAFALWPNGYVCIEIGIRRFNTGDTEARNGFGLYLDPEANPDGVPEWVVHDDSLEALLDYLDKEEKRRLNPEAEAFDNPEIMVEV